MKVAVIGAGPFGEEHLKRLAAMPDVQLAVADSNRSTASTVAQRLGIAVVAQDGKQLLSDFEPDAVIIATPGHTHLELARLALERQIPALVEKPMAISAMQAEELCRISSATGTLLMPGHTLRFSAPHRRLSEIAGSGRIGKLQLVSSRRFRDRAHDHNYPGIDPVMMTMIHDIDLALWFAGGALDTFHARRSDAKDRGSLTEATGDGPDGVTWRLQSGWFHEAGRVPPDRLEVIGTHGSLEYEAESGIRCFCPDGELTEDIADGDPLCIELDTFLRAIETGGVVPVTPRDALEGLRTAEFIIKAISAQSADETQP